MEPYCSNNPSFPPYNPDSLTPLDTNAFSPHSNCDGSDSDASHLQVFGTLGLGAIHAPAPIHASAPIHTPAPVHPHAPLPFFSPSGPAHMNPMLPTAHGLTSDTTLFTTFEDTDRHSSPTTCLWSGTHGRRYNPMVCTKPARPGVPRATCREDDLGDEEEDVMANGFMGVGLSSPEDIRQERVRSERRRRSVLRNCFGKLKDVLPVSNQKSSKVILLNRAVIHIRQLQAIQGDLQMRLNHAEFELTRLRTLNEMRDPAATATV